MKSSASSTDRPDSGRQTGFQPWQVYLLLSMAAATWAVIQARHTHPAALLLLSAGVVASGLAAAALHSALAGFFGSGHEQAPLSARTREAIEADKALVLRSLKELEFDKAMGKIGDEDFAEVSGRLRVRAMAIMEELDADAARRSASAASPTSNGAQVLPSACGTCATVNDRDAKFCKQCGSRLG